MDSFIGQALIFIGASVLLVPIFQRLGFGAVLGYLLAGILVGPYGLKLIRDSESIMHFSELGVTFLLFMIGLEIQPHKLWSMRRKLLGLGGMQVVLTTLIFMFVGVQFGLGTVPALVIGFGLSLSSTAFAVQNLVEKNQFNTEFGRSSFAILLTQDLFAIPALAIIPALGVAAVASGDHGPVTPNSFLALGIILGLVLTGRFVFRPVFRLLAKNRSREVFTAATLFIVLGVAALMLEVGLSAALGTFIAGVMLADSEFRHELEADLEPFKSLLLGLFFIAVGMGVNLGLIVERPGFIFGLAALYIFVKIAVIYAVGRVSRLNHENSKMMALTIAQGGEFAFVIFGLALQLGLAPSQTVAELTVIITLSMALNPFLILANERFCSLARKNKPEYDQIKDESPEVIIAGFGRFGQIFGRILRAQGIPFVAIDHDADQIELLRKFNNKVYYGDAARVDILEAAGAARAKYFVLAIDDVEKSLAAANSVKENFPQIKIFARARNRGHQFDLMDLGVTGIKREVLDSSLAFVGELLVAMGFDEKKAATIVERFRVHDEIMLKEQYEVRNDDQQLVSVSHRGQAQLAQVLADDTLQSRISTSGGDQPNP